MTTGDEVWNAILSGKLTLIFGITAVKRRRDGGRAAWYHRAGVIGVLEPGSDAKKGVVLIFSAKQ